jgi:hypothetical protein
MLFSNLYIIKKSFIKLLLGQYGDRAVRYFVEKLFFVYAICGKAHLTNLRICDCGIGPRICGFAICGLLKKVCLPTSALCWFPVHKRQYGGFFGFYFFYERYSKLLHLPPLRFQGFGGCWGRTQDCCYCTLALTARCSNHSERSHPPGLSSFQFPRIFCCLNPWGYFAERIVSKVL